MKRLRQTATRFEISGQFFSICDGTLKNNLIKYDLLKKKKKFNKQKSPTPLQDRNSFVFHQIQVDGVFFGVKFTVDFESGGSLSQTIYENYTEQRRDTTLLVYQTLDINTLY